MTPPWPRLLPIIDQAAAPVAIGLLQAGASHLLVRDKTLEARQLFDLVRALVAVAAPLGAWVLVSDRLDVALAAGAAGVQLPERGLPVAVARQLLGSERLLGRSCHDPQTARQALAAGADYVTLSPLFATRSHAEVEPLGVARFAAWRAEVPGPLLALGGITLANLPQALAAGADGAALIDGLLATADPVGVLYRMQQLLQSRGGNV